METSPIPETATNIQKVVDSERTLQKLKSLFKDSDEALTNLQKHDAEMQRRFANVESMHKDQGEALADLQKHSAETRQYFANIQRDFEKYARKIEEQRQKVVNYQVVLNECQAVLTDYANYGK